jgi:hypothetical protein
MRAIALFLCSAMLFPAVVRGQVPEDFWQIYRPGPDGLPEIPIVGQFFGYDEVTQRFHPVFENERQFNQIYIVYWVPWKGYGWVTPHDTRRILPGSKVQGHRIGMVKHALVGFVFGRAPNSGTWSKVLDRGRPTVYRLEPETNARVVSETAPAEWMTWGGELEPDPNANVSCFITAVPREVRVGETVRFDVEANGNATMLTLFGQELLLPRDFVERTFDQPGVYDVKAVVGRGSARMGCSATVRVVGHTGGQGEFGCTLTVEPSTLGVRQPALVTLRTFGNVSRFEYLNRVIKNPSIVNYRTVTRDAAGRYEVHGKVVSGGQEKTCRAPFTVTSNTSGR